MYLQELKNLRLELLVENNIIKKFYSLLESFGIKVKDNNVINKTLTELFSRISQISNLNSFSVSILLYSNSDFPVTIEKLQNTLKESSFKEDYKKLIDYMFEKNYFKLKNDVLQPESNVQSLINYLILMGIKQGTLG